MKDTKLQYFWHELMTAIRFVGAGFFNTAVTFVIYQICVSFVPYFAAYTISFAAGIALGASLNTQFVFGSSLNKAAALRFVTTYLAVYALGLGMTVVQVAGLGIPPRLAPIVTAVVLVPISYFGTRCAILGIKSLSL